MKNIIFISLLLVLTCSCERGPTSNDLKSGKSFRLTTNGDTCNVMDENGKKQGAWYTFDNSSNPPAITDTVIYKDGMEVK
jgi:hypothetical protein